MARKKTTPASGDYERRKARSAAAMAEQSRKGRDIGPIPKIANPKRRAAACKDFAKFCRTYFAARFSLPWCDDHRKVLAKIVEAVSAGGTFAMAMPRGSGKTTIVEVAVLWAVLTGRSRFVFIIGPDDDHATARLDSLKTALRTNDLLAADFPEACYAIRALEGIAQRAGGQLCRGKPTWLEWGAQRIVLPWLPRSRCAGAVVQVSGLLGSIRGQNFALPSGEIVRPDLAMIDDVQTAESARSDSQCRQRLGVVTNDILGMAGPDKRIAALMACTVIRPGDVSDRVLDAAKNPQWRGERCQAIYSWPADREMWDEYMRLRREGFRTGDNGAAATAFYKSHRQRMDDGAKVAWPERYRPGELSGVQFVMNELSDKGREYVDAELQNQPKKDDGGEAPHLTADEIAEKLSGLARGVAPAEAQTLTAFIDVQQEVAFWAVSAWAPGFAGDVIDYGTWPPQRATWFDLRTLTDTFGARFPGQPLEAQIYAALEACVGELVGREWKREDGAALRLSRVLVDAGYQTATVKRFCRRSPNAGILWPSHGRGIGPAARPISRYTPKVGERIGREWMIAPGEGGGLQVTFDSNWWKTFVEQRLRTPVGAPGCLALFGDRPDVHQLLAAHLTAEFRTRTEGMGRVVDVWKIRPERPDNHWLDCLVGNAVAASVAGVSISVGPPPAERKPVVRERKPARLLEW